MDDDLRLETKKLDEMKLMKKSEWFECEFPYEEPDQKDLTPKPYGIERLERVNGKVVWYGCNTNWVKTTEGQWTKLEGTEFVNCEIPIYEKLYNELNN